MNESIDESKAFAYCGADIYEGKLRLLFAATAFGSNADQCLNNENLLKALAAAPLSRGSGELSFTARTSVARDWEPNFKEVQSKLASMLGNPEIAFVPNFENIFAKLSEEGKRPGTDLRKDWERYLGRDAFSILSDAS